MILKISSKSSSAHDRIINLTVPQQVVHCCRTPLSPQLFVPLKFAAQLNRRTVWHNESKLYDMAVRVNRCEPQALQVCAPGASGDIEKYEFERLAIRRHLSLKARPISGVTIMRREQTIPVQIG